ncbi:MAG: hypothetical protein AMJ89_05615 [candidate division Zixibacteria bacterium SM23_73]|nr:MAG: hypothetical protein AMJ89_05615 [candidate division Zixibacteria bacterium SM23_73]
MIVWYYHSGGEPKPYVGESVREVFVKIWEGLRGTAIYSDDEQEFLRNFFKSRSWRIFHGAVEPFLAKLKERGFSSTRVLFCFR